MGSEPLLLLSPPARRYWPADAAPEERPVRRWRVLHGCESIGTTASVAEAQIQAGMRASVLTLDGWYQPENRADEVRTGLSLIHEWQRVRQWRNRLASENVEEWAEVLHAHCFAAAMALLSGKVAVVYDVTRPIGAGLRPKPGAWLLRSLRVAEQYVFSRADAVVVHSHSMWTDALQRGARADELFLVPEPVELAAVEAPPSNRGVTLFAPDVFTAHEERSTLKVTLQAFATVATEIENIHFIVEAAAEQAETVLAEASKRGLAGQVQVSAPSQRAQAMAVAHIVIADRPADDQPNSIMTTALAHGRALLAADVPQNREVTPQGRGCLWYRADDARDLAGRAAFLARNRDFRAALALSGREHVQATCGPRAVARQYDQVYRHAYQRRHRGPLDALRKLEVVQAVF